MARLILGAIGGPIVWFIAVTAVGFVVGHAWPEMAAIKNMALLTIPMLLARLCVSAVSSVIGGVAAALIGKDGFRAPLAAGVLLLIVFVPYHMTIWQNFPIWYHSVSYTHLRAHET